jgi:hypothetical protein
MKSKTFDRTLLIFTIVSILIIIFGYAATSKIVHLRREGAFDSWEPLSAPMKSKLILEATSQTVWVETSDGSIYEGNIYCYKGNDCLQWQKIEAIPVDLHLAGEEPLERNTDCHFGDLPFMKRPPGKIVECVRTQFRGPEYGSIIYYALLEDGSISIWKNSGSMIEDIITFVFTTVIIVIIWVFLLIMFELKSRHQIRKNQQGSVAG